MGTKRLGGAGFQRKYVDGGIQITADRVHAKGGQLSAIPGQRHLGDGVVAVAGIQQFARFIIHLNLHRVALGAVGDHRKLAVLVERHRQNIHIGGHLQQHLITGAEMQTATALFRHQYIPPCGTHQRTGIRANVAVDLSAAVV